MLIFRRLERKQLISSNEFRIRIFPIHSYSFGIAPIDTFIHSRSSPENHTRFQTKMGKMNTRFQRVSMGWCLLRLLAKILALLRLSVNFLQLRLTKKLKINFFCFKKLNIN